MDKVTIIAWVLATFGLLQAISAFLSFVAEKTKNTTDNKIANYFAKALEVGKKLIDFFTAKS